MNVLISVEKHRVASQTLLAGADVGACDMLMNNGRVVKLILWDITGRSEYSALTSAFYQGACGISTENKTRLYNCTLPCSIDNSHVVSNFLCFQVPMPLS